MNRSQVEKKDRTPNENNLIEWRVEVGEGSTEEKNFSSATGISSMLRL